MSKDGKAKIYSAALTIMSENGILLAVAEKPLDENTRR
jgi:hypothetical protein